ncbi:MAG TPA: hypothetical protein PLF71_03855 [bacterium]|nr:MAG: hypothetical protein BWY14_00913 [Parcubacteria group bacterium ADurb.Bin192]HPN15218.1 hypothetical protein [bacterium]
MTTIEDLKSEIDKINARNQRVEADKAWETSWSRKLLILALTYIVVVIFFFISNLGNPFINAIVPTLGFFLSTLTVPFFKNWWLNNYKK